MPEVKPTKEAAQKLVCGTCGKEVALGKPRTNVTRFLFSMSRCNCIQKDIDDAGNVVLKVADETPESALEATEPDFDKDEVESKLDGKYEVLSLLGQGGMGAVYKVKHKELGKTFAIKILNKDLMKSQQSQRRFRQESGAASKLTHPNLVAIYEHGISENGSPYLVMDYLEGTDLQSLLNCAGSLDQDRALPIFIQLSEALAHAHEKGVVHRDVKPENIILTHEGDLDIVKIVDFGIAKDMTHERATQRLTQTGEIFGSPMYMSPEQCLGNPQDARSDIYSFGCVMYEVLTGQPPFGGDNPVSIILKQVTEEPVPPKAPPPNVISPSLQAVIIRCLQKEPSERYQSANELLADLNTIVNGGTVKYKQKPKQEISDLRRMVGLTSAAVVVSLVLIVAVTSYLVGLGPRQSTVAPAVVQESGIDSLTVDELLNLGMQVDYKDPEKAAQYYQSAMRKGSSEAYVKMGWIADRTDHEQAKSYFEDAWAMGNAEGAQALGTWYKQNRDYKTACEWYQKAADKDDGVALTELAKFYQNGKVVPRDFKKAVELLQKAIKLQPYNRTAQGELGYFYQEGLGVPRDYKKAIELYTSAAEFQPEYWARVGDMYANGYGVRKDYQKAMEYYRQAAVQTFHSYAFLQMGDMYREGRGVKRDYQKAAENYLKGEKFSDAYCMYELAKMIDDGKVPAPTMYDKCPALNQEERWAFVVGSFQRMADEGWAGASLRLGDMYAEGRHEPKDTAKAIELYKQAASKNEPGAAERLKKLHAN